MYKCHSKTRKIKDDIIYATLHHVLDIFNRRLSRLKINIDSYQFQKKRYKTKNKIIKNIIIKQKVNNKK